jgi:Tol biopolymer transport system component
VIDLENRQPPREFALPEASTWIRWMPDGKALTYTLTRNGIANLWSQPMTGGQPAQITDLSFENVASFAWSRDGKRLAIVRVQEIKSIVFITGLRQ